MKQPTMTRRIYSGPGFETHEPSFWRIVGWCAAGVAFWGLVAGAGVAFTAWAIQKALTEGLGT